MSPAVPLLPVLQGRGGSTPLFDLVAGPLTGVPEPVREPARLGLRIMLPWTLSIAYRRTQQGVLIRFDRAHAVTGGTLVRLATLPTVLALGVWHGGRPGTGVGTRALPGGVLAETGLPPPRGG